MFTSTASLKLLSVVMMEERDESEADEIVFVVRVVGLRRDVNLERLWSSDADDDVLFIKSIPVHVEQSVDGLKKWARRNGHDRWWDEDEEAKSGLCAFLGAASNILHIVRIDTRMTYYPPVPVINNPAERSPRVNCTAGKCTQRDSSNLQGL